MQKVYNDNNFKPEGYTEMHTVRCVILSEDKKSLLLFGDYLIGGGVDDGESDEEAVAREALEEAGAELEIIKPLGEIFSYRDEKNVVYVNRGYLCKYIRKISEPTTTMEEEIGLKTDWHSVEETIARIEEDINEIIDNGTKYYGTNEFQTNLHFRQVNLDYIKEALK